MCKENHKQTISAFLIAPLSAVALYSLLLIVDPIEHPDQLNVTLSLIAIIGIISYLAEITLVLPVFLILRRQRLNSWWIFLIGGLTIGLSVAVFCDLPNINLRRIWYYVASGSAGILSAMTFRLILNLNLESIGS